MKWTLHRKFSVISFFVILILGLALAYSLTSYIEKQIFNIHVSNAIKFSQKFIVNKLKKDDFNQPFTIKRSNEFTNLYKQYLPDEVKRVKIWNTKGVIIYSEKQEIIGKKFPIEDELAKALKDQIEIEVSSLKKTENVTEAGVAKELIELYLPIKIDKEVAGAFELYFDVGPLKKDIITVQKQVWLFTFTILLVLNLTLYQIVKKGSDTILEQAQRMIQLNNKIDHFKDYQEKTHLGTLKALLAALEARDNYTAGHAMRVTEYALVLGHRLGLNDESLKRLEEAALLHDIGKIGSPEYILKKQGPLDEDEFNEMKKHADIGANIIKALTFADDRATVIRHHHEKYDGLGYPRGLKGEEIPLESRILAIADTFDALTSNRPYREKVSNKEAIEILKACRGNCLQADMVDAFIEVIDKV